MYFQVILFEDMDLYGPYLYKCTYNQYYLRKWICVYSFIKKCTYSQYCLRIWTCIALTYTNVRIKQLILFDEMNFYVLFYHTNVPSIDIVWENELVQKCSNVLQWSMIFTLKRCFSISVKQFCILQEKWFYWGF